MIFCIWCSIIALKVILRNISEKTTSQSSIIIKYYRISEDKAKSIFIQIVAALIELKRLNIVHRDLKLANILMTDDSTIKLADFGFAKLVPQNELLESYCGTPLTMAPEIYKFF